MTPDSINYQPLEAISNAWGTVMRTGLRGWCWPLAAVATATGVFLTILLKDPRAMVIVVFYFGYIGKLVNDYKNKVWDRFAEANGWGLDTVTSVESTMPPSLKFGHKPDFSPIIKAQLGDIACDLFSYNCTTGRGRSSQTHYFTVAVTQLPKAVPHILLRAKKGDAELQNDVADAETLKLEGDFNDYFKLQVEKGQEIDVLTVITPDVMQTLVSYGQGEDIEMLGEELYFIVRGDERGPDKVKQLIQSVIELSKQLKENIRLSTPQAPQPQVAAPNPAPAVGANVTPSVP